MSIIVFCFITWMTVLNSVAAYADTHWVNLNGSNESPYTSYATGALKIQDAIDVAVAGDTVRIAAGEYYPDTIIYLQDSLAIIGAGPDSTVILALYGAGPSASRAIMELNRMYGEEGGGLTVQGCSIYGENNEANKPYGKYGIVIWYQSSVPILIGGNVFKYCKRAVHIYQAEANVLENYFENNDAAIALGSSGPYNVHNNTIIGNGEFARGVERIVYLTGPTRIHHNTMVLPGGMPISLENDGDSIIIYNNLLVSEEKETIHLYCITDGAVVRNNTFIRNGSNDYWDWRTAWFTAGGSSKILVENNAFWSLESTVGFYEDDYLLPGGGEFEISHNSFWRMDSGGNGTLHYDSVVILDSLNNVFQNPMFADDSTYYLQNGSPLINAGNPLIFDLDSTRSDIGWTGGPHGTQYEYLELPPDRPDTLMAHVLGDEIRFYWPRSTEADLAGYRLYHANQPDFTPSTEDILADIDSSDTSFVIHNPDSTLDHYYKLTAVDTTGLESQPSNEVAIQLTGILEEVESSGFLPRTPYIVGNYPNPFNVSTIIEYYIPDIGTRPTMVQLNIYDSLGRLITTLVNEKKHPGKYVTTWDGKSDNNISVSSGVYFAKLTLWGYEFSSSAKLVLQK